MQIGQPSRQQAGSLIFIVRTTVNAVLMNLNGDDRKDSDGTSAKT